MRINALLSLTVVSVATFTVRAVAQTYMLTDVTTLPTVAHARVHGINQHGEVVGHAMNDPDLGPNYAFSWRPGQGIAQLDTLGGVGSSAVSLCDDGSVIGYSVIPGPSPSYKHAALWVSSGILDLGTLGGTESWAEHASSDTLVVGGARLLDNEFHPCYWSIDQVIRDLGVLPSHCCGTARAVNASGQVAGFSTTEFSRARAVVWEFTEGQGYVIRDLGTFPGGCCSEAFGINDAGDVVGFAWLADMSGNHAFVRPSGIDGILIDLGTLPGGRNSQANAINAVGEIVGMSWTSELRPGDPRACLWRDGHACDVNDLTINAADFVLTEATDINDAGQIAVNGVEIETGVERGFVLTPVVGEHGDFDGDADVDLDDLARWVAVLTGPVGAGEILPAEGNTCLSVFDFDSDGDLDLADHAGFQVAFSGS